VCVQLLCDHLSNRGRASDGSVSRDKSFSLTHERTREGSWRWRLAAEAAAARLAFLGGRRVSAYAHPPRDPNASSACGEMREGGIADAESMMMDGIGILSRSNFVGVLFR